MSSRRIETAPSRTADIVCLYRAASSMEKDPRYRTNDWVARRLLPRFIQVLFWLPPARRLVTRRLGPPGTYEWVIARTHYVDALFSRAKAEGFAQVVLLGAGFDSRAIRFQRELSDMAVFELDAPTTQAAKTGQYKKRRIPVPINLHFVPVNFEKEDLAQRLEESGFANGSKTLILMEGVTQYIAPEAIYKTMNIIRDHVGKGSWMVFDYAHASAVGRGTAGKDEILMAKRLAKSGETWQFGLSDDEVGPFLARFGFKIIDQKNPRELEQAYFKDAQGSIAGHISDAQSIVIAERC
jgi:methyltransferase (TIGR00027 family)